jgi:hypothetical protein
MWSKKIRLQENPRFYSVPCFHEECSILQKWRVGHFPSNTIVWLLYIKQTNVPHGPLSVPSMERYEALSLQFHRDSTPRGKGTKRGTLLRREFWAPKSHFVKVPPTEQSASAYLRRHKKVKDTEVFRSVPVWGPPPPADLRKFVRGVTLGAIIDYYKPNGKSCAISGPQLYAPTIRTTSHSPTLYTMQSGRGLHGFWRLVVDYIAASSHL